MSENKNAPSNPDAEKPVDEKSTEKSESKSTAKPSRTRGQKWRRRIIVALVTILLCIVGFRAIVPLLLPTVMRQVAAMYDLNADYDALDFSLLSADVGLWNLRFTPKSGGEPVMVVGYCRAAVSTWGLLSGRLDVERAEAEDAYVVVERLADGTMPLVERFMPKPGAIPATPATTQPLEIPLESPLSIKALRLQRGVARLVDRAVTPTTNVQLALNFILSDIGDPELPMRYSMQLHSPEILGALYVDGTGTARNNLVNADLKMRMISLNLQPLRSYLAAFGITPTAGDISATANGKLKMTPADGPTTRQSNDPITAVAIKLDLDDIRVTADSRDVASAKQVMVDIPRASPGEVRIESVIVDTVRAYAQRDTQGRIGFSGIALGADPTSVVANSTTLPTKTDAVSTPEVSYSPPATQPTPALAVWKVHCR